MTSGNKNKEMEMFKGPYSLRDSKDHGPLPCADCYCYYQVIHSLHAPWRPLTGGNLKTAGVHTRKGCVHNLIVKMVLERNYCSNVCGQRRWDFIIKWLKYYTRHERSQSAQRNLSQYLPLILDQQAKEWPVWAMVFESFKGSCSQVDISGQLEVN